MDTETTKIIKDAEKENPIKEEQPKVNAQKKDWEEPDIKKVLEPEILDL